MPTSSGTKHRLAGKLTGNWTWIGKGAGKCTVPRSRPGQVKMWKESSQQNGQGPMVANRSTEPPPELTLTEPSTVPWKLALQLPGEVEMSSVNEAVVGICTSMSCTLTSTPPEATRMLMPPETCTPTEALGVAVSPNPFKDSAPVTS